MEAGHCNRAEKGEGLARKVKQTGRNEEDEDVQSKVPGCVCVCRGRRIQRRKRKRSKRLWVEGVD